MIHRIQIDNFKSLDGFSLPPVELPSLANFSCLIGANGSGKTSVLQMFDYLSHLISSDVGPWVKSRGWNRYELRSKHLGQRRYSIHTSFVVELSLEGVGMVKWAGKFVFRGSRTNQESVEVNGENVLEVSKGRLRIHDADRDHEIDISGLRFDSSSLGILDEAILPVSLIRFKAAMESITSLELLSPAAMRRSSRPSDRIGWSGEYLAGFLHNAKPDLRGAILSKVREFFPSILQLRTPSKEYGWRSLEAREEKVSLVTSKHLSDGFLRVLAIISQVEQQSNPDAVILLDEIENGIHPELVERLTRYLLQAKAQVIVTTHSPLMLNYLRDEEAKNSVIFLYRNLEGRTRACRYFDLPSASRKLGILGPGEVYVDTPNDELALEAEKADERVGAEAGSQ